ncbi:MAG: hypothetical protein K9L85_04045 [Candidatus Peribacteraceae bacterium]|nr:hypothetical protein [Candidatus Peribacteraceae bacterium]
MKFYAKKFRRHDLMKHETKKHVLIKFLLVLLVFAGYFFFIAAKYGFASGFLVTALTWSFFVLCTPVADAGFLLDFPFRLITGVRMLFSEIFVWLIAILLNAYVFFSIPEVYAKTKLLVLFQNILAQPFPFWAIVLVSAIGTFMSILFGDELLDKARHHQRKLYKKHKHRYKLFGMIAVALLAIALYDLLLKQLGVELPI